MEEAFLRFQHLPEQILEQLDNESLANSRVVAISWREFIDDREYQWKRFMKIIAELIEKSSFGQTALHLACEKGQVEIAEMIVMNSAKLNIDWNAKNFYGIPYRHISSFWNSSIFWIFQQG